MTKDFKLKKENGETFYVNLETDKILTENQMKDLVNSGELSGYHIVNINNGMSYVRSNRDNTISNNLPNNQKMSKADELILKNILSYNQNGKKVREQNEIQRKRAENTNRLIEIQREEVKVINNPMTGQGSWKSEDGNILNDRYNNYNWDISKRDGQDNKSQLNKEEIDNFRIEFMNAWDNYIEIKEKYFEKRAGYWVLKENVTDEELREYNGARDRAKELHYARNQFNGDIPETESEMKKIMEGKDNGWDKELSLGTAYHQNGVPLSDKNNVKYTNDDGREVIYDKDGNIVLTDENLGTFNLYDPDFLDWDSMNMHNEYDVGPYNEFGNSINDSVTSKNRTSHWNVLDTIIRWKN